mgnify:CR=1 FL=1
MADRDDLIAGLEEALQTYRSDRQAGLVAALVIVLDYLGGKEPGGPSVPARLKQPLYGLLSDLAEKRGNAKTPEASANAGWIACAVDLQRRADSSLSLAGAASRVARATDGALTGAEVKELRKNIRRKRTSPLAQRAYWKGLEIAAQYSESLSDQEIASRMLEQVSEKFATMQKG